VFSIYGRDRSWAIFSPQQGNFATQLSSGQVCRAVDQGSQCRGRSFNQNGRTRDIYTIVV
jgi:hypothetical protein